MRIAIDGNEANIDNRVGIGEYAYELLRSLQEINTVHQITILLKEPPLRHMPQSGSSWSYKVIGPKFLWTQIALPFHLLSSREYDLIFSPTHYGPRLSPIPSVISIMDLAFVRYPNLFKKSDLVKLTSWTKTSCKKAKAVLTISEFSKKEIIDCYKIDSEKIFVTYPGYNQAVYHADYSKSEVENIKNKYNLSKYLLFVGTIQPRKNIKRLIFAFLSLIKEHPELKLVIVGKKGWLYEDIFKILENPQLSDKIVYLGYLEDKEIALLYKGAVCFVLPSLYEGFGLPVIEAMACGTAVVTSNCSGLAEIAGNAAILVEPESSESIRQGIEKIIRDDQMYFRDDLIKKGLNQAKKYSWLECAKKTLEILEDI